MAEPALLSKIDRLFACGVGEYVALPQLVVVGDQSSGKSSVLEGLTELPFPRDSGLCTRFATQITFRRAQETNISVSILPGSSASQEHVETIKAWARTNLKTLDPISFSSIIKEVHILMGLGGQQHSGGKATFSEDVLRLEVSGPGQEHFSVVDVPGIFRKTTEGVTTKADRQMVEMMVRSYMENPRSVMLTVIPCNVDIATQEILTMAEEVDEDGHRTLGVLTKPDLVDEDAEAPVMDLVQGRRHQLNLGWCLVRNPSQKQLNDPKNNRNAIEDEFFRFEPPWNTLDKERVGMRALRIRLQEILTINIRREFPKVKSEINKRLTAAKQSLSKLGAKRETTEQQRGYLLDMSLRFQDITTLALSTHYVGHDWFDQAPNLKFPTAVVDRNELFNHVMNLHGQSYKFKSAEQEESSPAAVPPRVNVPPPVDVPPPGDVPPQVDVPPPIGESSVLEPQGEIFLRTRQNHAELDEIMVKEKSISASVGCNTFGWLTDIYQASRGFELGTFNGSLLAMAMKIQSAKWEDITLAYISDVVSMAHTFIVELLRLICPAVRVREGLTSILMDDLMAKYRAAFDSGRHLLHVERMGTTFTLNHYFNDNLEKSRQKRMRAAAKKRSIADGTNGSVVRLDDMLQHHSMSNTQHIVRDIHDILHSYYKVARKRFVDNVCMQATDYHLVSGPNTPLKLFSPSFVNDLSAEQLEDLAGEGADVKRMRKNLTKEIANLEVGKKIII